MPILSSYQDIVYCRYYISWLKGAEVQDILSARSLVEGHLAIFKNVSAFMCNGAWDCTDDF